MKTIINILIAAVLIISIGCGRQITKVNKTAMVSTEKKTIVSDTGKVKKELVKETTTEFGDTLNASLNFPDAPIGIETPIDSVESGGLKIKGTLVKTPHGHKLRFTAVAKPVLKTDKTTMVYEERKGLAGATHVVSDSTFTAKEIGKIYKNTALGLAWPMAILLIIILILFIIRRFV